MVLLYATGGLAVTDFRVSNSYTTTNNPANTAFGASSRSDTRVGWTAGGGAEWALTGNWRVKAEYLYVDFGSNSTSANVNDGTFAVNNVFLTSANLRAHIARGGINYRF
jgi:outer membrane immunogenic protein